MGTGIVLRNALHGYKVSLYDKFKDTLDKAKETQETELSLRIENQTLTARARM